MPMKRSSACSHREDQLVQLGLHRRTVAVLGVLDQEHHQEGDDGRAGVDHQLPGLAELEDRPASTAQTSTIGQAGDEGPRLARHLGGRGGEADEQLFHDGLTASLGRGSGSLRLLPRCPPRLGFLLEGVAQRQDARVVPLAADEADPDRHVPVEAHGHGQVRIAGDGGQAAGRALLLSSSSGSLVQAREVVGATRATTRWSAIIRSMPSGPAAGSDLAARLDIGRIGQAAGRLGPLEQVLAEQHRLARLGGIEGDDVC